MKKILYITLLSLTPISFVHAYSFTQTFGIGSSGEDVYQLQKILNSNNQTLITSEGTGSKGNETYYFGDKTKDAVIRFQNLYKDEILTPNGLTQGTGYVGRSTINFLNKNFNSDQTVTNVDALIDSIVTQQILPITNQTASSTKDIQKFFVSKQTVQPKEILYVGSQEDLTNMDFYLDSHKMDKVCKYTKYTCSFYTSVNPGTYTLKASDASLGSYKIKVLGKEEKRPEVNITSLNLSKENIIKGKNFTDTVKVYTLYGVFESKTKNNSFILKFPDDYNIEKAELKEGLFYIENNNGLTSKVKNITYEK